MDWKKDDVGFDRIGHFKVTKNDGKNVVANYFSGGRQSGEKSFKVGDPDIEKIHNIIAQEYADAYQRQLMTEQKLKTQKPGTSSSSGLGGM